MAQRAVLPDMMIKEETHIAVSWLVWLLCIK
jgi:hypothetical protein